MRVVCVETGEDFGRVLRVTRRVSGKYKGGIQAVTTDRVMRVRHHPNRFVAFFVASRGIYRSRFVRGGLSFEVVAEH